MNFITVGEIINTFGNKGEVKIKVTTDFPDKRFSAGERVKITGANNDLIILKIEKSRWHKEKLVLKFLDYNSIDDAEKLVGLNLVINEDELCELPEDTFYIYQIIGLKVYDLEENYLGEVTDFLSTKSNDVYIVKNKETEILIPALKSVVKEVNLKQKKIVVDLLEEY